MHILLVYLVKKVMLSFFSWNLSCRLARINFQELFLCRQQFVGNNNVLSLVQIVFLDNVMFPSTESDIVAQLGFTLIR